MGQEDSRRLDAFKGQRIEQNTLPGVSVKKTFPWLFHLSHNLTRGSGDIDFLGTTSTKSRSYGHGPTCPVSFLALFLCH